MLAIVNDLMDKELCDFCTHCHICVNNYFVCAFLIELRMIVTYLNKVDFFLSLS